MMTKTLLLLVPVLGLAGCGGEAPPPVAKDKPLAFPAGEYEVATLTESLKGSDAAAPATKFKQGETVTTRICAAPGDKPDPALFIEKGDSCDATSAYAKNGRISIAYTCKRPGHPGQLMPTLDGKYDSKSFEVAVSTGSYFSGQGDYVMTQRIKGKRLGECDPAAPAAG